MIALLQAAGAVPTSPKELIVNASTETQVVLGTVVLLNNVVVATVLAPFLLRLLYPRIRHARLLYRDLLGPRPPLPRWRAALGVALVVAGTGAAFAAGELIASGRWLAPWATWLFVRM